MENLEKPVLALLHSSLERSGESDYRSKCPVCDRGILLVRRNQQTLFLVRDDNCVGCGQRIRYLDPELNGERFEPEIVN